MPSSDSAISPGAVGRVAFGAATIGAALLGLFGDARWFAASAAFGGVWWAWDALCDNVFAPAGRFLTGAVTGAAGIEEPPDLTVDDTIRLLERHLAGDAVPRHVQIQAALRLAEIFRLNKKDPAKAEDVIRKVREKWPDAKELTMFDKVSGEEVSGEEAE
jgi:hypothetical protein